MGACASGRFAWMILRWVASTSLWWLCVVCSDGCVEWMTVCTPPGCDAKSEALEHARAVAAASERIVTVVERFADGSSATIANSDSASRSNKLRLVLNRLETFGASCEIVVFADASDVLARVDGGD